MVKKRLLRFYTVYELDQEPGISYVGVQPEIMIMGPELQTYDLDATRCEFPLVLTIFGAGDGTASYRRKDHGFEKEVSGRN
ncbi:MAG: hypothetical protein KGZ54_08360 [Dethiobacter sp.]|jgi:hypothetical protein|nr:hypothetical protein [Dethiobacter sp.]MBS3989477.1 hypothetical protein [Dethiobacter sp.]